MKRILSLLIVLLLLFSSLTVSALDINMAYSEFKTIHPEFVKSLTDSGIAESTILSFLYDLYTYILELDKVTPVTEENFETHAIKAIMDVSSKEDYYSLQDALIILYPEAIKLAVTEEKVSADFKPLVDTVKRILFEAKAFGDSETDSAANNSTSVLPPADTGVFTDINESHWAYTAVKYLASNFILDGYLDGTFKPDNNITRAEFAKIIVSATSTYDYTAASSFSDVSDSDWYYAYVSTAYKLGYIQGYPDGSFRPHDNITRADICTIVNRVVKASPDGSIAAYHDDWAIPAYSREAVYALAAKGIVTGFSDGTFSPTQYATRAQTAKIIYSAFDQNKE